MKIIDRQSLATLCQLTARRDRHAHTLGMAFVELELAKAKALHEPEPMLKIGAAVAEFDGFRNRYMAKISEDGKRQADIGKAALRTLGLDPDGKATYTIDLSTGAVKELKKGAWEDVQ